MAISQVITDILCPTKPNFSGPLVGLSYCPQGKYIAAASVEGSIKILDTINKVLHASIDLFSESNNSFITLTKPTESATYLRVLLSMWKFYHNGTLSCEIGHI